MYPRSGNTPLASPMFGGTQRSATPMTRSKRRSLMTPGGGGSAGFGKRMSMKQTPGGGSGSFLTPSSASKRMSLPSSPFPSLVLEETSQHTLAVAPNSSAPVLVSEILTMADKPWDVSVNIGQNGWACLVHGRRLIIWRFGGSSTAANLGRSAYSCRELTLPPSDLAHHAKLVNVFAYGENQMPSCIAVSPEGIIRYWPSIAHESSFSELSADLQGQECFSLTNVQPVGSVLATTTSTVCLIYSNSPSSSSPVGGTKAASVVGCRTLKIPQGILGGISRRVSSLLWGGITSGVEAKLVQVLGQTFRSDPEEKSVFVLTANSLQKWLIVKDEPDRMFYSCDIEALAKEAFASRVWATENANPSWLKVWLLDMQFSSQNGLSILVGAINPQSSQQVYFAVASLSTLSEVSPVQFRSFCVLRHTLHHDNSEGNDNCQQLNQRFILYGSQYAYVYSQDKILCCSTVVDNEEPDVIDFAQSADSILGAGCCDRSPLFFTANQGLLTLTSRNQGDQFNVTLNDSMAGANDRSSSRLCESLNLSVSQSGLDNLTMSESKSDQLKAAFLLFCQRNITQSNSIIEELFPSSFSQTAKLEVDASLDKLVLSLSQDLVDDFPASDPRWMESLPSSETPGSSGPLGSGTLGGLSSGGMGSTMSLLILHQLEDKQRALDFFIGFLKEVGLWQRLSSVTVREMTMPTSLVLCEHIEKTATMISLRQIHSEYHKLMDKAIKLALVRRKLKLDRGGLTPQDHFYRQISRVEEVVEGLQTAQEEAITSEGPREAVETVLAVNNILVTILRDCLDVRQRKLPEFAPWRSVNRSSSTVGASNINSTLLQQLEFLPWTATPGPRGIRTSIINQFRLTNEKAIPLAEDSDVRKALCNQMVDLVDIVLDGFKVQLDGLDGERRQAVLKSYERNRNELIMTLVTREFHEAAASLAEKYCEFTALIAICEATNDRQRLEKYMDHFKEYDFADFVFAWHVKEGKQGQLLAETSSDRQAALGRFLRSHSDISWLHDWQVGQFGRAADTLKGLAEQESEFMARKKTMLSFAKLSALASDEDDSVVTAKVDEIEHQLSVLTAQEQLPGCVLESYGFERDTMRVLTPRELIELYIGEENLQADAVDFKKALDLLNYMPPNDENALSQLRLHIWCRAVLNDNWSKFDVDNPLESVKETLFFRLIEFCFLQDSLLLPDAEEILRAEELGQLKEDANFQFLIRSGYEHIMRVVREQEEMETSN